MRRNGPRRGSIQARWPSTTASRCSAPSGSRSERAGPCRAGWGRGFRLGGAFDRQPPQRPGRAQGPDRGVEGVPPVPWYVQPGRGVEDHPGLARRQLPGQPRQHVDGVPRPDRRRVGRHLRHGPPQQRPLVVVLRPHQRLQPIAGARVADVNGAEVDPARAADPGLRVEVRGRHAAVDVRGELDGGVRGPVHPPTQLVSVPVETQVEAGAGADLDEVHGPGHGRGDHAQPEP